MPPLNFLSEKLRLSPSVAGVTLMALGNGERHCCCCVAVVVTVVVVVVAVTVTVVELEHITCMKVSISHCSNYC